MTHITVNEIVIKQTSRDVKTRTKIPGNGGVRVFDVFPSFLKFVVFFHMVLGCRVSRDPFLAGMETHFEKHLGNIWETIR